jgi:hypothetical protein
MAHNVNDKRSIMRLEIQKIVDRYNKGELTKGKMQNEILRLSIVRNNEVVVCEICKEHILMADGTCPDCTIALCTPLEQTDF